MVRHLPNGFAIKFVETYRQSELARLIARKSKELLVTSADADPVA